MGAGHGGEQGTGESRDHDGWEQRIGGAGSRGSREWGEQGMKESRSWREQGMGGGAGDGWEKGIGESRDQMGKQGLGGSRGWRAGDEGKRD